MTWLAIRAFFGSALSWLGKLNVWQLALGATAIFALVQHFQLAGERRHSAKVEAQLAKEHAGRAADRKAYVKAQADAKAKNQQTIERVEHEQEQISDRVKSDYARDLERVRRQAASPARRPNPPKDGSAAEGAGGTDPLRLSGQELLRAQEIELQLKYLIDWVNQQSKVDPNREPAQ